MNELSLQRANAFLAAVAERTQVGEVAPVTPAEIGRKLDFGPPLVAARAVRALVARRRLEPTPDGRYKLLDTRPIEPGEKESRPRPPRKRSEQRPTRTAGVSAASGSTYSELGKEVVDRLIELGREVAMLRATTKTAREESREAREARDESEQRVATLTARVRELEHRAQMAESNLRTLLATARGAGRGEGDAPVATNEMEAILGVLKGDGEQAATGS